MTIKYVACEVCGDEGFACTNCGEITVFPEPRPLLNREAVRQAIAGNVWASELDQEEVDGIADAVMELARPMPTREQIWAATYRAGKDSTNMALEFFEADDASVLTDAVLALIEGAE